MRTLDNSTVSITVSGHGAELQSIVKDGTEYLWQGDKRFWGRKSPVLFPIVGSVWDKTVQFDGKTFSMNQHGFARDMDFELVSESADTLRYRLVADETSKANFPYDFILYISYRLRGSKIDIIWEVENTETKDLYFQIGAHPGFNFPDFKEDESLKGYFSFRKNGEKVTDIAYILIGEKGCADTETICRTNLENGMMPLDTGTFDKDAFIIEDSQIDEVILHKTDGTPWLGVCFNSPLVGLWSPPAKNAPFVCIEPWYGRCDRTHYTGEFKDRDHINRLAPGQHFHSIYTIEIK